MNRPTDSDAISGAYPPPDGMMASDGNPPPDGMLLPGEFIEDLQCEGLKIISRRDGFRYGTDSILLANYVKVKRGGRIVELCSGTGAVSVLLAAKTRASRITGVEIQEYLVSMANRSAALNDIDGRVGFVAGDIKDIRTFFKSGSADAVAANPPYLRRGGGAANADAGAAVAKHEICCELADVVRAAGWLLNPGGCFYMVYRPERLADLFCAMRAADIEPKEMALYFPRAKAVRIGGAEDARIADSMVVPGDPGVPGCSGGADDHGAPGVPCCSGVPDAARPASLILVKGIKCAATGLRIFIHRD